MGWRGPLLLAVVAFLFVSAVAPAGASDGDPYLLDDDEEVVYDTADHALFGIPDVHPEAFIETSRYVVDTYGTKPNLFLTFDDGNSSYTQALLDVLEPYDDVFVTFFPNCTESVPGTFQRILDQGHAIGNHTCNHVYLTSYSSSSRLDQWRRLEDFVNSRVEPDIDIGCQRPPFGATNSSVRADAASMGMREWGWNVDPRDWSRPGVSSILFWLEWMDDGDVIVMHDNDIAYQTVEAVRIFLQRHADDYHFRSLPDCGTGQPLVWDGVFWDDDGLEFEADIEWLAASGITAGCNPPDNDRFCPTDYVTRGQMAAFLVRALGYAGGANVFVDDDGSVFESAIGSLSAAGVTKGCNPPENDRFCPDYYVTRGQMAAFFGRAMGYQGTGDWFVDDDQSEFERNIDALRVAGVTMGCNPPENDRYCPDAFVTRAQMAAFLHRALGA